jgi:hypothetical protein
MSSGFPNFIVGAVAFGMVLIGVVPATAVGAAIPIILTAAAGMFLATIWSARIGESASAGISGIVGSFFLSYSLLVLGLTHNWYGIAPTAVAETQKVFVISWMVVARTMLVLATLRLPSIVQERSVCAQARVDPEGTIGALGGYVADAGKAVHVRLRGHAMLSPAGIARVESYRRSRRRGRVRAGRPH